MSTLINTQKILEQTYQPIDDLAQLDGLSQHQHVLVTLPFWLDNRATLQATERKNGIVLPNTTEPETLVPFFPVIALFAIEFPVFTDGRGYSLARMLRELGYRGELRAVGDVLADQIFYMKRCGFDTFALQDQQNPETALQRCETFTHHYQGAADNTVPVYRQARKQ